MNSTTWQQRRDILISVICIGIILWAAWTVLGQFVDVIVIMLLSLAVAFLVTPLVNLLVKYKFPRLPATVLVYIVVLAVLSTLSSLLIFSLVQQVVTLSATVVDFFNNLPQHLTALNDYLVKQGGIPQDKITQATNQISSQATTYAQLAAGSALNILLVLSGGLINILLIIVLSVYLTLDGKRIRNSLVSIIPQSWLKHMLLFEETLNKVVGNYIRGQLTLALIIGVLSAFVCIITGLGKYALIIGALGFLFETIPMVGPALASLPAILLSLLLPAPFPRTFYVIILFVVIQAIESNILGPRIVGRAVGLHPVASILALLAGAKLFGAFGALLATPIVAATWVMIATIYRSAHGEPAEGMLARRRTTWTVPYTNRLRERLASRRRHIASGQVAYTTSRNESRNDASEATSELKRDGHVRIEPEEGGERVTSAEKPNS